MNRQQQPKDFIEHHPEHNATMTLQQPVDKLDPELQEVEGSTTSDQEMSWTPEEEKKLLRKIDLFLL